MDHKTIVIQLAIFKPKRKILIANSFAFPHKLIELMELEVSLNQDNYCLDIIRARKYVKLLPF